MSEEIEKSIFSDGLAGKIYRLEAFTEKHKKGLLEAASNSKLWEFNRSDSQSLEEYVLEWHASMLKMLKKWSMLQKMQFIILEIIAYKIILMQKSG